MLGYLGHSLADFLALEPREIIKIIETARLKVQQEHRLQFIAVTNAIGSCFGGKDYNYVDAFADTESLENKETYDDEEVEFLLNNF